jgi:hypothetical protein
MWEEEHELELNFADVRAGSKVLISTRMKVLLDGGHEVEVGLPSPSDSARMLLAAADAEIGAQQPSGVSEVVDLCGRLPLALGIAGRLAASLGLVGTDDWSDMIGVLKEELRESHSDGAQEGTIRASLRGLKGSATEQANVRSLLLLFAYVPEDTHCPLEVLLLMFNAVHEGSGATMMHIRKWLRILVNRSLVLGTIDRPSLHDLVLDFAVAQHNKSVLCEQHRVVVEAFRAARPVDAFGRHQYDATSTREPLTTYVCAEGGHHVTMAMQLDKSSAVKWLYDVAQDEIVLFAARNFGTEEVTTMASRAEDTRDWWLAAQYWSLVRQLVFEVSGNGPAQEPAFKSLYAISQMSEAPDPEARDDLRFRNAQVIILALDIPKLVRMTSELQEILRSPAAAREPASSASLRIFFGFVIPKLPDWTGDMTMLSDNMWSGLCTLRAAANDNPDPAQRSKCEVLIAGLPQYIDQAVFSEKFCWETVYGHDGANLTAALRSYDYDSHHKWLISTSNADGVIAWAPTAPTMLHFGDIDVVEEHIDHRARRCATNLAAQRYCGG